MRHRLQALLLAPLLLFAAPAAANAPDKSVEELVAELRESRDMAEIDLIYELANKKTREALDGLLEVFDVMQSVWMRQAVVRGLAYFDGVDDAEQPALQKIMDVATESTDRDLREAAVDALAGCSKRGKAFLAMIVDSPADDELRERAMRYHIIGARSEDHDWYRKLWKDDWEKLGELLKAKEEEERGKRGKNEDPLPENVPWPLQNVRMLAFDALADSMEEPEVVAATADRDSRVRELALVQLHQRSFADIHEHAERAYRMFGENAKVRLRGARILADLDGADMADDFIKLAGRLDTPQEMRMGLAEIVAGFGDEKVDKSVAKLVGKGKSPAKLFALEAARGIQDEKLDKTIRKGLKDKDPAIVLLTLEVIGERGDREAVDDVQKFLDKQKDPVLRAQALDALTVLHAKSPEWLAQLVTRAASEVVDERNAAIQKLGVIGGSEHLELLVGALNDEVWSTRLAAIRALEALREKAAIEPLIDQLEKEQGRMQLEVAEALWRLTAQPFGKNPAVWRRWWADEQGSFEIVSERELQKRERDREVERLKQITKTDFFGIRVESHRVTFILDVSGSMEEMTRGRYVGRGGEKRIDLAKRELLRTLKALDKRSFFNLIIFSDKERSWRDSISEYNTENLEDAEDYVHKFKAGGATNLYAALRLAYDDPDVDTIFVLSDGEPTVPPTDPRTILGDVESWNEHRGVTIHCVAVGGNLAILEMLSQSTGGSYVHYP